MASTIYSDRDSWNVSNRMLWSVLQFASQVGLTEAANSVEDDWARELATFDEEKAGSYSPDLDAYKLFPTPEQRLFWSSVLIEVAKKIYARSLGNQGDQTWQAETIWAAYELGLLLKRAREAQPVIQADR